MASIADAHERAPSGALRKRRRFWLFDFLLSPFSDTDERAYYQRNALRGGNQARPVALQGRADAVRPQVRRFPREET